MEATTLKEVSYRRTLAVKADARDAVSDVFTGT